MCLGGLIKSLKEHCRKRVLVSGFCLYTTSLTHCLPPAHKQKTLHSWWQYINACDSAIGSSKQEFDPSPLLPPPPRHCPVGDAVVIWKSQEAVSSVCDLAVILSLSSEELSSVSHSFWDCVLFHMLFVICASVSARCNRADKYTHLICIRWIEEGKAELSNVFSSGSTSGHSPRCSA